MRKKNTFFNIFINLICESDVDLLTEMPKNMKNVCLVRKIIKGPWGGGNRFVIALRNFLLKNGHDVVFDLKDKDIDIILLTDPRSRIKNVSISTSMILRYLLFVNKNCIVIPFWNIFIN